MLLLVGLLVVTCICLSYAQLFPRKGIYPDLSDYKAFRIYGEGRFQAFNTDDEIDTDSIDKTWVNGGPKFSIEGDEPYGKAFIIGELGMEEGIFFLTGKSLLIIESPPAGSEHVLIIYNDWSKKEKGFRCAYVRHHYPVDMTAIGGKADGSNMTTLMGIAKPILK